MKIAIARNLGINCWLTKRFTSGECERFPTCTYPEKATCKAYHTATKRTYKKVRTFADETTSIVESGKGLGSKN